MAQEGRSHWETIRDEEEALVRVRRAWIEESTIGCQKPPEGHVGLALSGGGIRSATFSLGLLRSLSRAKLIHSIDYLSTVSGGGYAGAFLCSLFVPLSRRGAMPGTGARDEDGATIARALGDDIFDSVRGRQALAQLRQGGHYLAPNGTSDALLAAVVAVRNWFAVALVTGLAALGGFLLLTLIVEAAGPWTTKLPARFGLEDFPANSSTPWAAFLSFLAVWPAALGWAYWFARSGQVPLARRRRVLSIQSLIALATVALAVLWPARKGQWPDHLQFWIPLTAALALVLYAVAELVEHLDDRATRAQPATDNTRAIAQEDGVRHRLSRWLLNSVLVLGASAAVAGIYLLVDRLFDPTVTATGPAAGLRKAPKPFIPEISFEYIFVLAAAAVAGVLVVRMLLSSSAGGPKRGRKAPLISKNVARIAALLAGFGLLFVFLVFWASVARTASLYLLPPGDGSAPLFPAAQRVLPDWASPYVNLGTLTAIVIAAAFLLGQIDALLNRSSLASLYSGRLRAAYLGATNPRRWRRSAQGRNDPRGTGREVDEDDPYDEIHLDAYYDKSLMCPIHLINVTINETTSRSSRIVQRDRKGKSMTVAPSGYIYPPNSPAEPPAMVRRGAAEDLPLSSWIGISGAAFTTGAGHHTNLGTAMLAGLVNIRLGYWWENTPPNRRWHLRPGKLVQGYLLNELRANYEGTSAERWYLSDGGHYENTGVYELVRRRVPFIIASDNGADPNYEFADVVSLIRKLRIDFDAELEFIDRDELDSLFGGTPWTDVFGTLDDIRGSGVQARDAQGDGDQQPKAGPYATLARIRYRSGPGTSIPPSTLVLIKPRIAGRELPDLLQYREENAAFPQTPTTNQFFDEAQWESYYRLGQLIGDAIFDKDRFPGTTMPRWRPWELKPLSPDGLGDRD